MELFSAVWTPFRRRPKDEIDDGVTYGGHGWPAHICDGESHFGEVDIAMTMKPAFPNEAPFEISAYYPASRIRFSHIPAGVREVGFHRPPDRLLAIWLDGHVEFETSDGEVRRLPAGKAVLVEDTHGKGHILRHPEEGQNAIIVILPSGLDAPT